MYLLHVSARRYYPQQVIITNVQAYKPTRQYVFAPRKYDYLLTYLLTPCNRVPLEKLTGSQLDNKFPTFYGTRRFITAFTSASHLFLS